MTTASVSAVGSPEWANQLIAQAVQAYRAKDRDAVFPLIDAVLACRCDDITALEIGLRTARELQEWRRAVRYGAAILACDPTDGARRKGLARSLQRIGAADIAADIAQTARPRPRLDGAQWADPRDGSALAVAPVSPQEITGRIASVASEPEWLDRLLDDIADEVYGRVTEDTLEAAASALSTAGRHERALAWLDRPWDIPLDTPLLVYRRGQVCYALGRHPEADRHFACLEEDVDLSRRLGAALFRARIAHAQGDRDGTARFYGQAHALDPVHAEPLDYLVRHHLRLQDYEAADLYLAGFETAAPKAPQLVWLKAARAVAAGQPEDAIGVFRTAIRERPDYVDHHCRLADLLGDLGRLDEMEAAVARAVELAPASSGVFQRQLRLAQLRNAPLTEIIELAERLLTIDPKNALALTQRANGLFRLGRRDEALDQFLAAARLHPRNLTFWRSAASLSLNRHRWDLAAVIAEEARAAFDQGDAVDLGGLADVMHALGRTDEALKFAEAAVAHNPQAHAARQIAAQIWMATGRFDRAWPHLMTLQEQPNRSAAGVRLFAQAAAAFQYVAGSRVDLTKFNPPEARFPDALFEPIVDRSPVVDRTSCASRVLHVTSTLASGGAERQVALTVAKAAGRLGELEVELVAEDLDAANGRDFFLPVVAEAQVPIHILRDGRLRGDWREWLARDPQIADSVMALSAMPPEISLLALPMLAVIRERRPQVVHLWQDMTSIAAGVAAIAAGVPRVVLGIRSTRPVEYQRARPYFLAAYKAFLKRPGVSIVANSRNGARDYEDWLDLEPGSVDVVYNGYDFEASRARTDPARAAAARAEAGIPSDALVIGGVMRCSFEKRPELWTRTACELARNNPQVYGLLVGEGPMRAQLMAEVEAQGLADRIRFVGRQAPVEPWMQAMDTLFLSSQTEGLPNVLIEAQSLGVPVCTMRVGGAPETVVEGETAVVIDEGSPAEVAQPILELLLDRDRRARYGAAGVAWTEKTFSVEAMFGRLGAVYDRV